MGVYGRRNVAQYATTNSIDQRNIQGESMLSRKQPRKHLSKKERKDKIRIDLHVFSGLLS